MVLVRSGRDLKVGSEARGRCWWGRDLRVRAREDSPRLGCTGVTGRSAGAKGTTGESELLGPLDRPLHDSVRRGGHWLRLVCMPLLRGRAARPVRGHCVCCSGEAPSRWV